MTIIEAVNNKIRVVCRQVQEASGKPYHNRVDLLDWCPDCGATLDVDDAISIDWEECKHKR